MTENQTPRRTPPAADPPLGTPEGDRAFVRRTALRRLQRNRRLFSIVVTALLVLSFVVFLVTEFILPRPTATSETTVAHTTSAMHS